MSRNVAVILAGGVGARVGLGIPKQLIKIAGRTILEHTIAAFTATRRSTRSSSDGPGSSGRRARILRAGHYPKVTRSCEGAETRNGTTLRALDGISDPNTKVLFHDAVRPMVTARIIANASRHSTRTTRSTSPSGPPTRSSRSTEDNAIRDDPGTPQLRRGQTPQAFRASTIKEAYANAANDKDFVATDDCTVVLSYLPRPRSGWSVATNAT